MLDKEKERALIQKLRHGGLLFLKRSLFANAIQHFGLKMLQKLKLTLTKRNKPVFAPHQ